MRSFLATRRAALALVLGLATALPLAAQEADISGSYLVEGRNPDGTPYAGTAVLTQRDGEVQINWTVQNDTYAGTGLIDGQVVLVDWDQPAPIVYVLMTGGELHGTWAGGTALERLIPQR